MEVAFRPARYKVQLPLVMDPLQHFPQHISADIVHLSLPHPHVGLPGLYIDRLLDLTTVSRHWEQFILSEPQLWTTLNADSRLEDSLSKIVLGCSLSAKRALTVRIDTKTTGRELENMLLALKQHRERIVNLDLIAGKYVLDGDLDACLRSLEEIVGSLPALKRLELGSTSSADEGAQSKILAYANIHPKLASIDGLDIKPTLLNTKWPLSMKRVVAYVHVCKVIPHLHQIRNAESATFHESHETSIPLPLETPPPVHWHNVELFDCIPGISRHLIPSFSAALVNFTVTIDSSELSDLFYHLHPAAQLRRLHIILAITDSVDNLTPDDTFAHLLQLTTLQIRVHSFDDEHYPGSLVRLLRLLVSALPNVAQLDLSGEHANRLLPLCASVDGLPNLKMVNLTAAIERRTVGLKLLQLAPSITRLEVQDECDRWSQLRSGNVSELTLRWIPRTPDGSSRPFKLKWWPNLVTLRISNSLRSPFSVHGEKRFTTMKHLTTLNLTYDHQEMEYASTVTPWMVAAVEYARSLPCLENWVLDAHIEWDIFFIMLEARNSTKSPLIKSNVRPIKSVKFTSTAPFKHLCLVLDILAGWRVERPSNLELSWRGNLDGLLDTNVSGCMFCHRSLIYCRYPSIGSSRSLTTEPRVVTGTSSQHPTLPKLSPYPDDDLEVLRTWRTREDEWQRVKSKLSSSMRAKVCRNWYTENVNIPSAVTITAEGVRYTYDDP